MFFLSDAQRRAQRAAAQGWMADPGAFPPQASVHITLDGLFSPTALCFPSVLRAASWRGSFLWATVKAPGCLGIRKTLRGQLTPSATFPLMPLLHQPAQTLLCFVQGSIDICIKRHKSQHLKALRPAPSRNKEAGNLGGGKAPKGGSFDCAPVVGVAAPLPPLHLASQVTSTAGLQALHSVPKVSPHARELFTSKHGDLMMLAALSRAQSRLPTMPRCGCGNRRDNVPPETNSFLCA